MESAQCHTSGLLAMANGFLPHFLPSFFLPCLVHSLSKHLFTVKKIKENKMYMKCGWLMGHLRNQGQKPKQFVMM